MKDYFKIKTWLITALMFMAAFALSSVIVYYEFGINKNLKVSQASASDNVNGWAWSSNIGWISFNCTDVPNSCSGGTNPGTPCPSGTECTGGGICQNTCSVLSNYGVSLDVATGYLSGYAWSASAGWVSFNENNAPDYTFNTNCSSPNCTALNNCTACYNWTDSKLYGWGKILTLGDDGWIKLRKFSADGGPDYGVSINSAGDFSGWAWNANEISPGINGPGIGWISFNCADVPNSCSGGTNPGTPCPSGTECTGGGICQNTCSALSNYKVVGDINRPPTVENMTAPNWSYSQAASDALHANLQFSFVDPDSGSYGSAYQIIITKADDTPVSDTAKCTGYDTPSANPVKCKFDVSPCLANGTSCQYLLDAELNYATSYKWSVMVWDDYDTASQLTQYVTSPDTPLEADDSVVQTFTTYKHEFPRPGADWFPKPPSRGEEVKFTDASKRFVSAAPTTEVSCTTAICDWLWTAPIDATIDDDRSWQPTITFNSAGANTVKLKITDIGDTGNIPYYAEVNFTVNVNAELPVWKEVKP